MWILNGDVIDRVAHALYASEYASECDERGIKLPCGGEMSLQEWVPTRVDPAEHYPIIYRFLGRIEAAWGADLGMVLHHGGIETEDDQEHFLFDLCMGCMGHGVTARDDFSEHLDRAAEVIYRHGDREGQDLDGAPIRGDGFGERWRDMASGAIDAREKIEAEG